MTDTTILYIGAGNGQELADYLNSDAAQIILVEPNPVLADSLRQRSAHDPRVQVKEIAITDNPAHNQLVEYNLPEANSLAAPRALRQIFPGLRALNQTPVATQTIATLVNNAGLSGDNNRLIIEAPGAERAILKGLIEQGSLEYFGTIELAANHEPYYEGSASAEQLLADLHAQGYDSEQTDANSDWPRWSLKSNPLKAKLKALKLEKDALTQTLQNTRSELQYAQASLAQKQTELDRASQDIEQQQAIWAEQKAELEQRLSSAQSELQATKAGRDHHAQQVSELKAEIEQSAKRIAELEQSQQQAQQALKEQLEAAQAELASVKTEFEAGSQKAGKVEKEKSALQDELKSANQKIAGLESELKQTKSWLSTRKEELVATEEELEKHKTYLSNRKQQLEQAEQQVTALKQHLKEQAEQGSRFESLEAKIAGLAGNITGYFDKQLSQTSKQIQSSIDLQSYLQQGNLPVATSASFSPDLALYIAERLESNRYDVIIEFGGGSSTAFFARTLQRHIARQNDNNQRLSYDKESDSKDIAYVTADEFDLPKRIVTFEHQKSKHEKIKAMLASNNLDALVHLAHAPLVDYHYNGSDYLFYDCDKVLKQIANVYDGRAAKILALASGPPAKAGFGAKIPTVPALLNTVGRHTIDVVLCASSDEQAALTLDSWSALLERRGVQFTQEMINPLQGLALVSIEQR